MVMDSSVISNNIVIHPRAKVSSISNKGGFRLFLYPYAGLSE